MQLQLFTSTQYKSLGCSAYIWNTSRSETCSTHLITRQFMEKFIEIWEANITFSILLRFITWLYWTFYFKRKRYILNLYFAIPALSHELTHMTDHYLVQQHNTIHPLFDFAIFQDTYLPFEKSVRWNKITLRNFLKSFATRLNLCDKMNVSWSKNALDIVTTQKKKNKGKNIDTFGRN